MLNVCDFLPNEKMYEMMMCQIYQISYSYTVTDS